MKGDSNELKEAVKSFIDNSIKYTPSGNINITLRQALPELTHFSSGASNLKFYLLFRILVLAYLMNLSQNSSLRVAGTKILLKSMSTQPASASRLSKVLSKPTKVASGPNPPAPTSVQLSISSCRCGRN